MGNFMVCILVSLVDIFLGMGDCVAFKHGDSYLISRGIDKAVLKFRVLIRLHINS